MGLDIVYYRDMRPANDEDQNIHHLYVNADFPERADDLISGAYVCVKSWHFRAGSYSGYNVWRNELALIAGYHGAEDAWSKTEGPFWELINFSDCEGLIGPKTSKKLAQDFADYQGRADLHEADCFKRLYKEWRKAFHNAQYSGAVSFC